MKIPSQEVAHLLVRGAGPQFLEAASRLRLVAAVAGVERPPEGQVRQRLPRVLPALHLAVHHPGVFPGPCHMVDFRREPRFL